MKKNLTLGLLALALVLSAQHKASAYSKFNFGVGLNLGWEGAGNSVLWGVLQGGPAPGQMTDGGYQGGHGFGHSHGQGFDQGYSAPGNPGQMISPAGAPESIPAKPMPAGTPGVAQPVGYFPYADPAVGYYPGYNYPAYPNYPTNAYPAYYGYPMYYAYPMYQR